MPFPAKAEVVVHEAALLLLLQVLYVCFYSISVDSNSGGQLATNVFIFDCDCRQYRSGNAIEYSSESYGTYLVMEVGTDVVGKGGHRTLIPLLLFSHPPPLFY